MARAREDPASLGCSSCQWSCAGDSLLLQMSWPHLPTVPFLPPTMSATLSAHAGAMEMPPNAQIQLWLGSYSLPQLPAPCLPSCSEPQNQGPFQNRGRRDNHEDLHTCVGRTARTSPIGVVAGLVLATCQRASASQEARRRAAGPHRH